MITPIDKAIETSRKNHEFLFLNPDAQNKIDPTKVDTAVTSDGSLVLHNFLTPTADLITAKRVQNKNRPFFDAGNIQNYIEVGFWGAVAGYLPATYLASRSKHLSSRAPQSLFAFSLLSCAVMANVFMTKFYPDYYPYPVGKSTPSKKPIDLRG